MYKKDAETKSTGSINEELFDDNQIARAFKEANDQCLLNLKSKTQDIFQTKEETFEYVYKAPTPEQARRISETLDNKEIIHKKLLDSNLNTGFWSLLSHKIKKIFNSKYIPIVKKDPLLPVDWKYYQIYKKKWKKHIAVYLNDMNTYVELTLKDKSKFQKIKNFELFFMLMGILFSSIFFVWSKKMYSNISYPSEMNEFLSKWITSIICLSSLSISLLFFPYLVLLNLWFININHLYKSKQFHYFVTWSMMISFFLLLISLFNLVLFELMVWKYELIATHAATKT